MEKVHAKGCPCNICTLEKQQEEDLAKSGFCVHLVFNDSDFPYRTNAHTHMVYESFGHLDIQLCLDIPVETISAVMHNIVDRIKAGERFLPQNKYSELIENFPVLFEFAYETDRLVLRVICPDESGSFKGKFKSQYEGTFTLYPMHRRIIKALYEGDKSIAELNRGNYNMAYDVSQLILIGLVEAVAGADHTFTLTEHGWRLYEHLHPVST